MIRLRFIGPVVLALLLLPMPASGQAGLDTREAEAVVRQAFQAHAAMKWDSVAALMHPDALRRFHSAQIERHRMREQLRSRPSDERYSPDMPPEVRAWFDEQQVGQGVQYPSALAADFAGVSSLSDLEALSPEAAFARWVEAHDARALLVRHTEAIGRTMPAEVPLADMHPTNRIVGSVVEDDSTVQVLYRVGFPTEAAVDDALGQLAIATARRSVGGWRIWTTQRDPQFFGMENWSVEFELPEERAERLRELADQSFTWPEGETPRVRASVKGYAGGARPPVAVRFEVVQPDGSVTEVELPYEVLAPLWEYLEAWMYLPTGEDGVQPGGSPHNLQQGETTAGNARSFRHPR
jgi:hypothetical protein